MKRSAIPETAIRMQPDVSVRLSCSCVHHLFFDLLCLTQIAVNGTGLIQPLMCIEAGHPSILKHEDAVTVQQGGYPL